MFQTKVIQKIKTRILFWRFADREISVFNQPDTQNLFHKRFISCLYMFRAHVLIIRSLWYHHTYRCDDTRGCVMQFWPPEDEHICSKHVEAWNKSFVKQILCIKLVKYRDKTRILYPTTFFWKSCPYGACALHAGYLTLRTHTHTHTHTHKSHTHTRTHTNTHTHTQS